MLHRIRNLTDSRTPLLIRFTSTITTTNPGPTLNYLINTCNLTPQSARKASKYITIKSTTGPDSVLSLLTSHGFTKPHLSKLIFAHPRVLLAKPDETLKPKLEFFTSVGVSGASLVKLITKDPSILMASLENQIMPSVNFLRTLVSDDSIIVGILGKSKWVIHSAEGVMGANISILRDHGVPQDNILRMLKVHPESLYSKSDRFNNMVVELEKLGFRPSGMMFMRGIFVLSRMKKPTWDGKLDVYRSFGWSEDEVLALFKKQPNIMAASAKKINLALDFFMNNLKWTRGDIAKYPVVMFLSMERRIVPRCHVLQILLSKKLVSKISMGLALRYTEDVFLRKYVSKYRHEVPDLLEAYQSKMGTKRPIGQVQNETKVDKF